MEEIKTEIVGFVDDLLVEQIVEANSFDPSTHGNQYRKTSIARARPKLVATEQRSAVVRTNDIEKYSDGGGIGQSDAEPI